ncbi:MAG: response regulator [Mariprofundaceae bacterium]
MKIVIIDDNQTNLMLLEHLVKKMDSCESKSFMDPTEALTWCAANDIDLVMVDYMMPSMNGIEFSQQFKKLEGKSVVPIIMITASHDKEIRHEALQKGVSDFVTKPIDRIEVTARANNLLLLHSSQKKLANKSKWLAEEVRRATNELALREREAIMLLSKAAEFRDPETGAHIIRMSHYSKHIAKNLKLDSEVCETIFIAAPMHDIGKVGTPDSILLKPGRLEPDEFKIMKEHAGYGYQILHNSDSKLLQIAATIANSHHEKFDGSGYPKGLKGEDIPLVGRIVAVADVFDALTSARPYKEAWPLEKAINLIKEESGKHFDPECVDAFFHNFDDVLTIKKEHQG